MAFTSKRRPGKANTSRTFASQRPKRKAPFLKNTTRKGAYGKGAKKNFQKRRQPFVETKNQTDAIVALKGGATTGTEVDKLRLTTEPLKIEYTEPDPTNPTANIPKELTILPIQAYMNMNQGLDHTELIGHSAYARYLKCKLEFQLPFGGNQIRHPCDMFLIHGFITQPIGTNLHTVPTALDFTRTDYMNHIDQHLREYFNQRRDKLEYIPKQTSNIQLLGYRKLKVKRASNLGPDPQALVTVTGTDELTTSTISNYGSHPVINMSCSWPMKKKLHYTRGKTNSPNGLPFFYTPYAWIPFVALFNPTANEFLSTVTYPGSGPATNNPPEMFVRYNSAFYYSDS